MTAYTSYNTRDSLSDANMLKNIVDRMMLYHYTILPCRIIEINDNNMYDVQSIINGLDTQGNPITPNVIHDVPVAFETNSHVTISYNYAIGDVVLVGFCQRNIDNAKYNNWTQQNPASLRKFDIADAVIIKGLNPGSLSLASIVVGDNGDIDITSANKVTINATSEIDLNAPNVAVNSTTANINATTTNINSGAVNLGNGASLGVLTSASQFSVTVNNVQPGMGTASGTATLVAGTQSQTVKATA